MIFTFWWKPQGQNINKPAWPQNTGETERLSFCFLKISRCYSSAPDVGFRLHIILVWKTGRTCPTAFSKMTNSCYVSIADQLKAFPQASTHTGITLNQRQVFSPLIKNLVHSITSCQSKITPRLLKVHILRMCVCVCVEVYMWDSEMRVKPSRRNKSGDEQTYTHSRTQHTHSSLLALPPFHFHVWMFESTPLGAKTPLYDQQVSKITLPSEQNSERARGDKHSSTRSNIKAIHTNKNHTHTHSALQRKHGSLGQLRALR